MCTHLDSLMPQPLLDDHERQPLRAELGAVVADASLGGIFRFGALTGEGDHVNHNEVRGDVLVAKGEPERARSAYEKALANLPTGGPMRNRIQMKLDDLGHVSVTTESES